MSSAFRSLFEDLHMRHHTLVTQMCLGFMKGDRQLADDLSQDVWINIWNGLEKFKGESSHKTWLYRITVNTCLQYIRKEKKNTRIDISDPDLKLTDDLTGTWDSDFSDLYHAIGHLGRIDRLIIMMVLDELEYEEISKVVGISAVNLRVKIHRIKERLKKILTYEPGN